MGGVEHKFFSQYYGLDVSLESYVACVFSETIISKWRQEQRKIMEQGNGYPW
jgi:hypothetical protein